MSELIDFIIRAAADEEDGETGTDRCIEMVCEKLAEQAKAEAFKRGALEAGIPLSVIEGKTKLSDHFSPEYIRSQTNKGETP